MYRSSSSSLLILLFLLFWVAPSADGRVLSFSWDVKKELSNKQVIAINGYSPGPTVRGLQGDRVVVKVTNNLPENLAINWNRVRLQIGDQPSGGTEGASQSLVLPGRTFAYRFTLVQAGEFLYSSRFIMQTVAGLYGWIRVLPSVPEPFAYDYEQSIILNDWFNSTDDQAFYWDGEPALSLVQGKTAYNVTNSAYSNWTVITGKTYRLRISSVAILYALSFQIEGHNLTVVEAEGQYIEPFVRQNLFIYPGQTYSVLIKADQDPLRNYWILTNIVGQDVTATTSPGLNVLNYDPNDPKRVPPMVLPAGMIWNDVALQLTQSLAIKARQGYVRTPPSTADRVIVLLIMHNKTDLIALEENFHRLFNQHPLPDWLTGVGDYDIHQLTDKTNATSGDVIYRLKFNTTVDIILQNSNTNDSKTLPWHLHGHYFWVLRYGMGKFDVDSDPKKYNLANPIMKSTVAVHSFGWTALRFVADNPGGWAFYCKVESHFSRGMGVVFEVGGKLSP